MKLNAANIILGIIWLALIMALLASMEHTAWGFATLNGGSMFWGYAQALAIDLGMAALALAIRQRKIAGKHSKALWAGVGLFCVVSVYANLLYGTAHAQEIRLQDGYEWAGVLVWLRPILFSGVLPILVVYLLEVVGERSHYSGVQAVSKKLTQTVEQVQIVQDQSSGASSEAAIPSSEKVQQRRQDKVQKVYELVQNGSTRQVQIVRATGFSKSLVAEYVNELIAQKRISKRSDRSLAACTSELEGSESALSSELEKRESELSPEQDTRSLREVQPEERRLEIQGVSKGRISSKGKESQG